MRARRTCRARAVRGTGRAGGGRGGLPPSGRRRSAPRRGPACACRACRDQGRRPGALRGRESGPSWPWRVLARARAVVRPRWARRSTRGSSPTRARGSLPGRAWTRRARCAGTSSWRCELRPSHGGPRWMEGGRGGGRSACGRAGEEVRRRRGCSSWPSEGRRVVGRACESWRVLCLQLVARVERWSTATRSGGRRRGCRGRRLARSSPLDQVSLASGSEQDAAALSLGLGLVVLLPACPALLEHPSPDRLPRPEQAARAPPRRPSAPHAHRGPARTHARRRRARDTAPSDDPATVHARPTLRLRARTLARSRRSVLCMRFKLLLVADRDGRDESHARQLGE